MDSYCTLECPYWNEKENYCTAAEISGYDPKEFAEYCPMYKRLYAGIPQKVKK